MGCARAIFKTTLWSIVLLHAAVLGVAGLAILGLPLTVTLSLAAYVSPRYRMWITSKSGYKRRLGWLPGLMSSSRLTMALATGVYLFIVTIVALGIMAPSLSQNATSVIVLSPIGIFLFYGWFIHGWRLPPQSTSASKELRSPQRAVDNPSNDVPVTLTINHPGTLHMRGPNYVLTRFEDHHEKINEGRSPMKVSKHLEADLSDHARISILFLSADPTNSSRLRLGQELREIQEMLQLAKLRERFKLEQRMSVRPADISQALLDVQPQIVHFSGHGTVNGELCFENPIGEMHPITPDALAALFEHFASQLECVVLNACYSRAQADAIAKYIGSVIGMDRAIGDKAAIAFAIGFYQALGAGQSVEDAYKLGCVQIRLQGIPDHLIPVMIKKKQL